MSFPKSCADVMMCTPGKIGMVGDEREAGADQSDIMIALPRLPDVSSPEFNAVCRDLARRLKSHMARGRELEHEMAN